MFARTHTLAYWKHCNTQRPQVSELVKQSAASEALKQRTFARTHTLAYWKHCNTQQHEAPAVEPAVDALN